MGGRKVKNQYEVLIAAAQRTTSFQTLGNGLAAQFDDVLLVCNCTAVAGGGAVVIAYQVSLDGGTNWVTVDSMTAVSGAGVTAKRITAPIGPFFRLDCAVSGTSIDFEVRGNFHLAG